MKYAGGYVLLSIRGKDLCKRYFLDKPQKKMPIIKKPTMLEHRRQCMTLPTVNMLYKMSQVRFLNKV